MRPLPTRDRTIRGQVPGRPDSLTYAPSPAPMACFITSESNIDTVREGVRSRIRQQPDHRKNQNTPRPPTLPNQRASPSRAEGSASSVSEIEPDTFPFTSRPDTPLFAGFSGAESVLGSSSSRRSSVAMSSFEYQSSRMDDPVTPSWPASLNDKDLDMDMDIEDGTVPQLIMPSLTVPSRRPFSEVGKSLGKLKIMVAGRTGVGKTSLIRSLAQHSEHIVHIDPIVQTSTAHAAEIYASSRPQPWWRADLNTNTRAGRRRSSMYEMLDRNVCFVESPGHLDGITTSWRDLNYVESCLNPLLTKPMDDSDLLALLNAGGEPIVDVLLYLIPHQGLTREDIEYMKHAQCMTNVIPILARVDQLGSHEVDLAKQAVTEALADANLGCFSFAELETEGQDLHVYAVSTETQADYDVMDASVLMNSEYVQPLVPTDLGILVDKIFSLDGSARLRHSAAVKCVRWRRENGHGTMERTLQNWSLVARPNPGPTPTVRHLSSPDASWSRVDFYNWAGHLRQSLHAERLYHVMATRPEPSASATESRLVPLGLDNKSDSCSKKRRKPSPRHQDPLGILELGGLLKQKGMLALEMLSTLSLLGFVIARLTQPRWSNESCHGAMRGLRRVGFDVSMLGSVLS